MDTNELLDRLKTKLNLPSDRALALQFFKIDPMSLKSYRQRGLPDERAPEVARALNYSTEEILAHIHSEKASSPEVRQAWERMTKIIKEWKGAALAIITAVTLTIVPAPKTAQAAAAAELANNTHYARFRRLWVALRALFAHVGAMARIAFASLVVAALVGCGQPTDNHGYGWHYDAEAPSGLRVRWNGPAWPSLAYIDELWHITSACVGAAAPGPLVIFIDDVPDQSLVDITGLTYLDTGTVLIQKRRDGAAYAVATVLKHEFVHWLMHYNGRLTAQQQLDHDAPEFLDCRLPSSGMPIAPA